MKALQGIVKENLTVSEGLVRLREMVKLVYLARELGVSTPFLTHAINGSYKGGKPFRLNNERIRQLNEIIQYTALCLIHTHISREVVLPSQSPIAFGALPVNQIRKLGEVIRLPYLFEKEIGWKRSVMSMRVNRPTYRYYGVFRDDQLQSINLSLQKLALKVAQIHLIENEDEPQK